MPCGSQSAFRPSNGSRATRIHEPSRPSQPGGTRRNFPTSVENQRAGTRKRCHVPELGPTLRAFREGVGVAGHDHRVEERGNTKFRLAFRNEPFQGLCFEHTVINWGEHALLPQRQNRPRIVPGAHVKGDVAGFNHRHHLRQVRLRHLDDLDACFFGERLEIGDILCRFPGAATGRDDDLILLCRSRPVLELGEVWHRRGRRGCRGTGENLASGERGLPEAGDWTSMMDHGSLLSTSRT